MISFLNFLKKNLFNSLPLSSFFFQMWYSFNRGQVSWIIISTETDYPKAFFPNAKFGNQIQWLHTTLKAAVAARKTRPWIFVVGHRPVYCADKGFIKCDKVEDILNRKKNHF